MQNATMRAASQEASAWNNTSGKVSLSASNASFAEEKATFLGVSGEKEEEIFVPLFCTYTPLLETSGSPGLLPAARSTHHTHATFTPPQ